MSHSRNARSTVSVSQWEWKRWPSASSSCADFQVIVDFAVEGDGGVAVVADEGLIAARQVDDLQADGAQRGLAAFEDALLVGPAMVQRFGDPVGDAPAHHSVQTCKSRNPAHLQFNPRSILRWICERIYHILGPPCLLPVSKKAARSSSSPAPGLWPPAPSTVYFTYTGP